MYDEWISRIISIENIRLFGDILMFFGVWILNGEIYR